MVVDGLELLAESFLFEVADDRGDKGEKRGGRLQLWLASFAHSSHFVLSCARFPSRNYDQTSVSATKMGTGALTP